MQVTGGGLYQNDTGEKAQTLLFLSYVGKAAPYKQATASREKRPSTCRFS